jgi:hypothetical protein
MNSVYVSISVLVTSAKELITFFRRRYILIISEKTYPTFQTEEQGQVVLWDSKKQRQERRVRLYVRMHRILIPVHTEATAFEFILTKKFLKNTPIIISIQQRQNQNIKLTLNKSKLDNGLHNTIY